MFKEFPASRFYILKILYFLPIASYALGSLLLSMDEPCYGNSDCYFDSFGGQLGLFGVYGFFLYFSPIVSIILFNLILEKKKKNKVLGMSDSLFFYGFCPLNLFLAVRFLLGTFL